ncbi:hypothetical protein C8Q70DRAFT_1055408 [Cubamyces menziesii]|nr:hypothetical protein C8Q70DRAFT_1055408 [Cubamyces menziesii]
MSYGPTTRIIAQPPTATKRQKAPKIPAAQRAAMAAASRSKREVLVQDLKTWYGGVTDFAAQLAKKYGKKSDHYLQLMFSGGTKQHKERKVNTYNTWSYIIAKEINEAFYRTSKAKANYLKGEIRDKVRTMLCTITGNPNAVMNYANHEQEIVLCYGVELVGWTHSQFANPLSLSISLPPLCILLAALESGACSFQCLSPKELEARQKAHDEKVVAEAG